MRLAYLVLILAFSISHTVFAVENTEVKKKHLPLSPVKDEIDDKWLANMTGLPDKAEVEVLSKHVVKVMKQEKNKRCLAVDKRLRHMIFLHFAIYQHMANKQSIYLDEKVTHHWAHVFAMLLKESSGDSTNVTSMTGRSISTYRPKTSLERWDRIEELSKHSPIPLNDQTNFGLTQLSADRLFVAFKLASEHRFDTTFLEGREGPTVPGKSELDTAIAIRRLIWFYQDFSQGRLKQSEDRIRKRYLDLNKPEHVRRYSKGLELALVYCGTNFLFDEGLNKGQDGQTALKDAMSSISYCKLGTPKAGYGFKTLDKKCFAQWVTLCPALNFDIALITPMRYFATRNERPVCEDTFKELLVKKPEKPKKKHQVAHNNEQKTPQAQKPPKLMGDRVKALLHAAKTLFSTVLQK